MHQRRERGQFELRDVQPVIEPPAHKPEVTINAGFRNMQQFCCLLGGEAQKESEFDHPAFAWINLVKFFKHPVEIKRIGRSGVDPQEIVVQRNHHAAIALLPKFRPCVINQHAAHQARRQTVKMFPILKPEAPLPNELQEKLIHDTRWLQKILCLLSAEERPRNLPQMRINQFKQSVAGRRFAFAPLPQQNCNLSRLVQVKGPLAISIRHLHAAR